MHILFALPGLHRVNRGAEVAFESVAQEIALKGRHRVTVAGSGQPIADRAYDFQHIPNVDRKRFESWPKVPFLRNEFMYEDMTFAVGLAARGTFGADLTVTCNYPYSCWALRKPSFRRGRPAFVFVTQNSDWPAFYRSGEARFFSCDGLLCTNPIYYERNKDRWHSALIPNGLDPTRFHPGEDKRAALGLPTDRKLILMVSALEAGKRVIEAMRAVAMVKDAYLVIAGDGPQRQEVDQLASQLLPGRFKRATYPFEQMPDLYRSADVFLHTKIEESFGNVYIEALSSGIPIVAHDDEVTRWILGNHAHLVDSTSAELLAAEIQKALPVSRGYDADAVAWAHKRYAWAEVANQYEKFFEDTLARKRNLQLQDSQ